MFTDSQQQDLYALVLAQRCLLEALLQRQAAMDGARTGQNRTAGGRMACGTLDDVQCRARFLLRETALPGLTPEQLDSLRRRAGQCLDDIDDRARLLTV